MKRVMAVAVLAGIFVFGTNSSSKELGDWDNVKRLVGREVSVNVPNSCLSMMFKTKPISTRRVCFEGFSLNGRVVGVDDSSVTLKATLFSTGAEEILLPTKVDPLLLAEDEGAKREVRARLNEDSSWYRQAREMQDLDRRIRLVLALNTYSLLEPGENLVSVPKENTLSITLRRKLLWDKEVYSGFGTYFKLKEKKESQSSGD